MDRRARVQGPARRVRAASIHTPASHHPRWRRMRSMTAVSSMRATAEPDGVGPDRHRASGARRAIESGDERVHRIRWPQGPPLWGCPSDRLSRFVRLVLGDAGDEAARAEHFKIALGLRVHPIAVCPLRFLKVSSSITASFLSALSVRFQFAHSGMRPLRSSGEYCTGQKIYHTQVFSTC